MGESGLLDAVVDIYSAPGNLDGWVNALETTTQLVGGETSGFIFVNNSNGFVELTISTGYSDELIAAYSGQAGAVNDDVRYQYRHNLLPGRVFRDMEYVESRDEWNAMPWNVFEREQMGIYYCMTALVSTHGVWSDYIAVNRLESKGPNTDAEKQDLQKLLPHLSRASELHRLVNRLNEQFGLVLSVLDRLRVGVVIFDKLQRIVTANTAAYETASNSGSFRLLDGRFKIVDLQVGSRFLHILTRTIETAVGKGDNPGGCLVLNSQREGHQVVLDIMPLRDDGFSDSDNVKGAVIFILDPVIDYPFSVSALREIFNLTTSETQVAELLVNGFSVNEISEQRNSAPNTVRDQLKSVYQKTDTSGQLDLLRKVVKASPPIKQD